MTITLSGPPAVPGTRWNYGASVDYSAQGIGQDMRVTLSPGNDDTIAAIFLASSPITAGTLPAHASPPPGAHLAEVLMNGHATVIIPDQMTRAYTNVLIARWGGATAATVAITGEALGYKIPQAWIEASSTFTTSSATFVDVTGTSMTVATTDAAEVFANAHVLYTGQPSLVAEFRVVIDALTSNATRLDGTNTVEAASISYRSTGATAGTHTVKIQARYVSGAGSVSILHADCFAQAMQANTV